MPTTILKLIFTTGNLKTLDKSPAVYSPDFAEQTSLPPSEIITKNFWKIQINDYYLDFVFDLSTMANINMLEYNCVHIRLNRHL